MKAVKTVSNQHIVSPCSAAARCCAGLAHAISRTRAVWLVLAALGLLWPGVASAVGLFATTLAATNILSTGATLNASINPVGSADAYFAYGTNTTSGLAVSTLAGTDTNGFVDATGAAARFDWPRGVAMDAAGNVYVADYNNNRIRKVSPTGVVTTLAGTNSGFADGTGAAAQFNGPIGVAVDSNGIIYVADYNNHRIRKVTPAGVVTTLAGTNSSYGNSYADGTGAAAKFYNPSGVAVDASGNVYVADEFNDRIRKVTPTGVVTTLAGTNGGFADGPGATARFTSPRGVAVDAALC